MTNPWRNDTDNDGIPDGKDMSPLDATGLTSSVIELVLKAWQQEDLVDVETGPELRLVVTLGTAVGSITVNLKSVDNLTDGSLAGKLFTATDPTSGVAGIGRLDEATGIIKFDLTDNVDLYGGGQGRAERLSLRIAATDADDRTADDVIDISRRKSGAANPFGYTNNNGGREYIASDDQPESDRDRPSFQLTQPPMEERASGVDDDYWFSDDDDAILQFTMRSLFNRDHVKRALLVSDLDSDEVLCPGGNRCVPPWQL